LTTHKTWVFGFLALCSHTLVDAQTLESSAPPDTSLAPSQQVSETLPSTAPKPQLPSSDDSSTNEDEKSEMSSAKLIPEIQVIEDPSESSFGMGNVEYTIEHLLSKKKITGALVGTTISAALSAHPLGAFLGGLVGAMVGKESKYQVAEPASFSKQDLFRDLDQNEASTTEKDATTTPKEQQNRKEPKTLALISSGQDSSNQCYQDTGQGKPRNRASLRHCFYYMN